MCKCKVVDLKPKKNSVIRLFGGYHHKCTEHNREWYSTGCGGCCALSEKEFIECAGKRKG